MNDVQKFLLLRYSNKPVHDCILQHKIVIDKLGYCWFGKIGNIPSNNILTNVFEEEQPILVLYRKNDAYICQMDQYSFNTPKTGFPEYYEEEGIFPSISFRLTSIEPCNDELLHNSIVVSTGAYVEDVVYHSRIPFMLCAYVDESKQKKLGENDCRYRKDEYCTCRTCVNYDCLCERPNSCVKQRR